MRGLSVGLAPAGAGQHSRMPQLAPRVAERTHTQVARTAPLPTRVASGCLLLSQPEFAQL